MEAQTTMEKKVLDSQNMDELLHQVGSFGPYQWLLTGILALMLMALSFHPPLMYFAALNPTWECVSGGGVSGDRNDSSCVFNGSLSSGDDRRCRIPRHDWRYSEPNDYSIVTQFDLNCGRRWFIYLTTSVFFVGWCIGGIALGSLSDNYGRKPILMTSLGVLVITGLVSSFSPNVYVFAISRLFVGLCAPGVYTQALIMASELVGREHRAAAMIIINSAFPTGCSILGVVAYLVPKWKSILIICTAPFIFLIFTYKFVPESLRWLRVKGKVGEATRHLKVMARINGKVFPSQLQIRAEVDTKRSTIVEIFRTKVLLVRSLVLGLEKFTHGLTYYGLLLAANDLSGSIYLDFIILNLVHIPSNVLAIPLLGRYGRKRTLLVSKLFAGISCLAISFIPRTSSIRLMRTILGNVGTVFITIVGSGMYLWSSEIYPTTLRSSGMGFLDFVTHVGAASSPWIAKGLVCVGREAPFVVMGVLCIFSFFFLFLLPETKGRVLAECADDIDK